VTAYGQANDEELLHADQPGSATRNQRLG